MADDGRNADRSSIEIKSMLRKLHPDRGNHKDRIRRFNKFRSYVMPDARGNTPEFYDDDIPILFMGSTAPAAYRDEEDDTTHGLYGLLQACGTPSGDHDGTLKRSARHAMNLLKWLLVDFVEKGQKKSELSEFATSFLSLPASYYHHMNLDLHCSGDQNDRGGSLEDACQVIALILTQHLSEDGERQQPVNLDELMSNPRGQQEFEIWSARNLSSSVQETIKKNASSRQSELALRQREDAMANKALNSAVQDYDDDSEPDETETEADGAQDDDDDDVIMAFRKKKKALRKELKEAQGRGEIGGQGGLAERWEDSQLAREQRARAAKAARAGEHETVRDSQEAAQEAVEREEEKAKSLSKDPLGLVNTEEFDLRNIEKAQAETMEQALAELQQEVQKAEGTGVEKLVQKIVAEKDSLEALVENMGGIEGMENLLNLKHSILPTSSKFDPVLFLTLVHRTTPYSDLIGSLERLTSRAENQAEQLQNLVRDNFPLFVRCAEGFEEFRYKIEDELGMGIKDRIEKLEAIAESGAHQAKKSFKPLLDNTSEVRKVQSAMAVLQRTAPILQVPALMRQHVDNRRYSEALKAYHRVLVVDDNCNIKLLLDVRAQAEECVREARTDLEHRLAQSSIGLVEVTDSIRDLGELLALDVPSPSAEQVAGDTDEESRQKLGIYTVGDFSLNVREYPPALACLLLQAAHFAVGVNALVKEAEKSCARIFEGDSTSGSAEARASGGLRGAGNQWKYDILDSRVSSTVKAVAIATQWLPLLTKIGTTAREDEKRRAARIGPKGAVKVDQQLSAFEVFITNVSPVLHKLVEHAAYCAIGSATRVGSKDVVMTFGQNVDGKLRTLLKSPLPPSQCTKVGKELVELVPVLAMTADAVEALRPSRESSAFKLSPLEDSKLLADSAVITIEKRRCLYAFDVCARACSNRASGSGVFDADALINCLQKLSDQLSRPDQCSSEVEKGCELVVRRCCEGLASFVRDRDDTARLAAVAQCSDVMADRLTDIIREASALLSSTEAVHDVMMEDVMGLESALFDEYLENVRLTVGESTSITWLDVEMEPQPEGGAIARPSFPPYLAASLLAIVRCRAQVEQSLGSKLRRSEGMQYQHLTMATVADSVVEGICNEVTQRKLKLKVRQADRLANELEFVRNTLKKFLSEDLDSFLESTLHMVSNKAGRGRDFQRDGPDGLAALEELERLGRVYVLCLGE